MTQVLLIAATWKANVGCSFSAATLTKIKDARFFRHYITNLDYYPVSDFVFVALHDANFTTTKDQRCAGTQQVTAKGAWFARSYVAFSDCRKN